MSDGDVVLACHAGVGDRGFLLEAYVLLRTVIDDGENPEAASVCRQVVHEVKRSPGSRRRRCHRRMHS